MILRAQGVVAALASAAGFGALLAFLTIAGSQPGGGRAVEAVIGIALVAVTVRLARAGLYLEPTGITVRDVLATYSLNRAEVLGLATQPVGFRSYRRLAVVCVDGRVVPASWTLSSGQDAEWPRKAAWAAHGFGETQTRVAATLESAGRLAGTEMLPVASRDPGLTPQTVSPVKDPDGTGRWLGWETIFVVAAFALPAVAAAVVIFSKHVAGISDLDNFKLPLPGHAGVSLVLLIVEYTTSALIVPIALLLLARTGQPPDSLGLTTRGLRRDAAKSIGMYGWIMVLNVLVGLSLFWLHGNSKLGNTAHDTHVPAYFIIYALTLSATTAINEEVLVNGYFLTRLAQRGWSPQRAFALSLAVRTSYHAYYGIALVATIPLGWVVTRSFQKRQRLGRPIIVHFVNDAILLVIAVLTS